MAHVIRKSHSDCKLELDWNFVDARPIGQIERPVLKYDTAVVIHD